MYRLLAQPPRVDAVRWDALRVYFGDERCVGPDHPDSNFRMACQTLLDHVDLPADHIRRMRGETEPAAAADEYEDWLRRDFADAAPDQIGRAHV